MRCCHLRHRRAGRLERRHRQVHADGGPRKRRQPKNQVCFADGLAIRCFILLLED